MTPAQIMTAVRWVINILLFVALIWFLAHYRTLVRDRDALVQAAAAHTAAITTLTGRIRATEDAQTEINADAAATRAQVTRGVAALNKARRDDPDTQKVDIPWPAAVRFRVFDNPDPTSGSTARTGVAGAGTGRVVVPVPGRADAGSSRNAGGHRPAADSDRAGPAAGQQHHPADTGVVR